MGAVSGYTNPWLDAPGSQSAQPAQDRIKLLRSKIRSAQVSIDMNDRCTPQRSRELQDALRLAWDEYDREVIRRALGQEVKP